MADAFANQDPDGNGLNDTFAFGSSGGADYRYFDHIFSAFGVLPYEWMLVDGEIVNSGVQPGAREALRALNKIYEMGALDPEFITDDQNRSKAKFVAGNYGAPCYFFWVFDTRNKGATYVPFHEANPDGEWIEGPILKSDYSNEEIGMRSISLRGWIRTGAFAQTKELDAVLRLVDWMNREDSLILMNFGFEGEHYDYEGEVIVPKVDEMTYRELGITQTYISFSWKQDGYSPELHRVKDYAATLATSRPIEGLVIDNKLSTPYADFEDFARTQYLKIIVGEISADEGFEALLDEWDRRGAEDVRIAYNEAYKARYGG